MRPPEHMTCHETGHKKKCADLCMNCWKWVQILGHNPNTGEQENQWKCADAWLPILMIENSQQQRSTGAAVESFRNAVTRSAQLPPAKQVPEIEHD
jgi:hypothetical protein